MKIKISFDNPLEPSHKITKTITFRGKRKEYYAKQVLNMFDEGMVIMPVDISVNMGDETHKRTILISSAVAETKGHRGQINSRPGIKARTVTVVENNSEPKQSFWKRFIK